MLRSRSAADGKELLLAMLLATSSLLAQLLTHLDNLGPLSSRLGFSPLARAVSTWTAGRATSWLRFESAWESWRGGKEKGGVVQARRKADQAGVDKKPGSANSQGVKYSKRADGPEGLAQVRD